MLSFHELEVLRDIHTISDAVQAAEYAIKAAASLGNEAETRGRIRALIVPEAPCEPTVRAVLDRFLTHPNERVRIFPKRSRRGRLGK